MGDAKKELQDFVYLASHEFEAPIRHIRFFVNSLKKSSFENLDDKAKNHLRLLEKSHLKLNQMVDGLLLFSRAGSLSEKKEISALACQSRLNDLVRSSKKKIDLSIDIDERVCFPCALFAIRQLRQVCGRG